MSTETFQEYKTPLTSQFWALFLVMVIVLVILVSWYYSSVKTIRSQRYLFFFQLSSFHICYWKDPGCPKINFINLIQSIWYIWPRFTQSSSIMKEMKLFKQMISGAESKNDRRNSGGTHRQKFNLNDIWNYTFNQWTNGPID